MGYIDDNVLSLIACCSNNIASSKKGLDMMGENEPCKQSVALRHTLKCACVEWYGVFAWCTLVVLRMPCVHKAKLCTQSSGVAHGLMARAQCYS